MLGDTLCDTERGTKLVYSYIAEEHGAGWLKNRKDEPDDEGHFSSNCLLNTGSSNGGTSNGMLVIYFCNSSNSWIQHIRDEDGGSSSASLLHSFSNASEDGLVQVSLASLLGICAANNLSACNIKS